MQAILRPVVSLAVAGAAAAQAFVLPQGNPESILPASTYAAVRFGGLHACRDAAATMPLAAALQDFLSRVPAEVRAQHLDQGLDQAAAELQEKCEDAGVRAVDLRAALGCPMALAMGRLSIEGMGPSVALVVAPGEHRRAVNRLVQWGAQQLAEQAGAAEQVEIGGTRFHALQLDEGPSLFAGGIGPYYVITNSRGYLREMLAVAAGQQPALASSSRLGQLHGELPAAALASMFLNTGRLLESFAPHLPYESAAWADALGVGGIDAVYWGVGADQHGGADLLHLGIGGSEHGLFKALLAQPVDLSFAQACSPNTVVFAAGSLDLAGVVGAFERFAALLPPGARDEMMEGLHEGLDRGLSRAGTTPEELHRLLQAFGNQIGAAVALEKGAVPKPELLVRIAVRDAEVVTGLLQQLEHLAAERGGLEWKARKVGEHTVRFCNVQPPELQFQLSPCYVVTGDALWFGSDAAALVRALRQDAAESLSAQADFRQLVQEAQAAGGVVHWRLFRAAEIGWRTVETMVYPQIDSRRDELGFGSEALPDAETMARALGTSTSFYRVDGHGLTVRNRGALANGALVAALGALVDEVLGRAGGKVY